MDTSDRGLLDIQRFDREPAGRVSRTHRRPRSGAAAGLSTEEKIPHVLANRRPTPCPLACAPRCSRSNQTISTWPQLASSVAMGGAVAADVARRILLGLHTESGRFFVDVEETVRDSPREPTTPPEGGEPATPPVSMSVTTPPSGGADVPVDRIRHLVTMASLAPSGGNAQPWRWLWQERALHLSLDARHSRALLDFQSLASVASLGAAAENLVLRPCRRSGRARREFSRCGAAATRRGVHVLRERRAERRIARRGCSVGMDRGAREQSSCRLARSSEPRCSKRSPASSRIPAPTCVG